MNTPSFLYAIAATALVSTLALVGIFTLAINVKTLKKLLIYLVSFAAGSFFGSVFFHMIPEHVAQHGWTMTTSVSILTGLALSFFLEKVIHWRHCHMPFDKHHTHRFAYMSLFGDAVHNFIDGIIIGASFLVSIPLGIAATTAVILHELPQEIGDTAVLVHGGFTRKKAILFNFFTALTALAGTTLAFVLTQQVEWLSEFLIPFAAGSFIYIAGADLIPELHKDSSVRKGILQLALFAGGIALMFAIAMFSPHAHVHVGAREHTPDHDQHTEEVHEKGVKEETKSKGGNAREHDHDHE